MKYTLPHSLAPTKIVARGLIIIIIPMLIVMSISAQSFVEELNSHRTNKLEIRKSRSAKHWCELLAKNNGRSHDLKNRPLNQAEIILGNYTGESECYEQWYDSPPHRRAMLDESNDYVAFYIVKNRGMYYAVARFWEKKKKDKFKN